MHIDLIERLPAYHNQLWQILSRLRLQLGLERVALFALRGVIAGSVVAIALSALSWMWEIPWPTWWLAAAPVFAAIVFGLIRWPSSLEAAIARDRRARLDERLATAAELARRGANGRFDGLQIQDAVAHTRAKPHRWLLFNRRARNEAIASLLMVVLAAASSRAILSLPRPVPAPTEPSAEIAPVEVTAVDQTQSTLAVQPAEVPTAASAQPQAAAADLSNRVQQEQAERSALDKLAQGLSNMSAAQPAADAIEQGDFGGARDQLQNLADNSDQLSDAAKQQLARGLQQAASATGQADRALADREQQAAQALTRSNYADQRQALRNLGDQVQRSGARSVPSDQLERDLGQLRQQQSNSAATGTRGDSGGSSAAAQSAGAGADDQTQANPSDGQGGSGAGNQGGAGAGTGANPDSLSNQPTRLDTAGQRVEVPTKLGSGPGVRPPDGSEDSSTPDPSLSGGTVSQLPQSQQTGQVTPEQNLVPGEQRPLVRGYFR